MLVTVESFVYEAISVSRVTVRNPDMAALKPCRTLSLHGQVLFALAVEGPNTSLLVAAAVVSVCAAVVGLAVVSVASVPSLAARVVFATVVVLRDTVLASVGEAVLLAACVAAVVLSAAGGTVGTVGTVLLTLVGSVGAVEWARVVAAAVVAAVVGFAHCTFARFC